MKQAVKLLLDEADVRLIKELQADSRQSMRSLSGKLGISTPTVASKVQRLIDGGAIKSFSVILDSAAFGLKDYVAEVRFQPRYQKEILRSMVEMHHALLTQDSRLIGLFSGTEKEAAVLYNRMCQVKGVTSVSLTPTVAYDVNSSRPSIESGARLSSACYYCRGDIGVSPVVENIGGKQRYFCCTSCSALYLQKYRELKNRADK